MANAILVSFSGYPVMPSSLFPNNGLASLAAVLLRAGHGVRVLDYGTVDMVRRCVPPDRSAELRALLPALAAGEVDPEITARLVAVSADLEASLMGVAEQVAHEIAAEVAARGADFVGFTLWSGDGLLATVRIAQTLRRLHPGLRLFGGGPAVLYSGETIFRYTGALDALCDGEGEEAILGLARSCDGELALSDVPNLILPGPSGGAEGAVRTPRSWVEDLSELPDPVYDPEVYPSLAGDGHIKVFVLDESRGCPSGCAFCIHQKASGRLWRVRDAGHVAEQVAALGARFGTRAFRFGGSYTPATFYEAFADLARQARSELRFCGFAHMKGFGGRSLRPLYEGGARAFFMGVESFHRADRHKLGKHLNPERSVADIRACLDAGIAPVVAVIVPVPGQSEESLAENRRLLLDLCGGGAHASVVTTIPGLLPRTRWWTERDKYGFELLVPDDDYRHLLARYKIRHILPPAMWEPLPYRVDGMDFATFGAVGARFQQELRQGGVAVNVPDEVVLLADCFGEPIDRFLTRYRAAFLALDAGALADFVHEANQRVTLTGTQD